tara:strand:+ start:3594 stop:4940 length:1347 start_codon:yes stop_codon:yes gene_type:complete
MKTKRKKIKVILITIVMLLTIFSFNLRNIYDYLPTNYQTYIKNFTIETYDGFSDQTKIILRALNLNPFKSLNKRYLRNNPVVSNLDNDYNVKFLPQTQYQDFYIDIFKINFKKKFYKNNKSSKYGAFDPFYFEIYKNNLIFINSVGEILTSDLKSIFQPNITNNFKNITSNLAPELVMGSLIHNDEIFISYRITQDNCQEYRISKAKINLEVLAFDDFYVSKDCGENLRSGAMAIINFNGSLGLLATIGGEILNQPTDKAQSDNSDIGKTLFIDLESKKKIIYSKGHRNPQGLLKIDENVIISTEHGPFGGDEINKIIFEKNYGWPVASYGLPYKSSNKFLREPYAKNHEDNFFEEPIFSFIPSIGISQIISIPNKFSKNWQDNYLLSSLNGASLYRMKFSKDFNKIIFMERIFIGKRIRDLKYEESQNALILALEDFQEIMILKAIN